MIRTSCDVSFYINTMGKKVAGLLLVPCICLLMLTTAHADSPLLVTHDKAFGAVTVGAVDLQLDTIRWAGLWSPAFIDLSGLDTSFGFTGDSIYNDFTFNYPLNTWRLSSLITAIMKNPAPGGAAPALGFWFSPDKEGQILSKTYTYSWPSQSNPNQLDSQKFSLSGVGVADDPVNPKITLEVTTAADEDGDKNINLSYGGNINFQVTARSTDSSIKHVMLTLNVSEKNGCINENVSFQEKATSANEFPEDGNGYFHYIVGYDPDEKYTAYCIRPHTFIVSVDKPFTVEVKNLRPTRDGAYAKYDFYVRGHYDAANPELWPGSHDSYTLTSNNSGVPVDPDTDGDGINDSTDDCPYYHDPSNACPDPDGDKKYGTDDKCPNYYDPSNVCSDRDGDNIYDNNDNCPDDYDPSNECDGNTVVETDNRPNLLWPYNTDLLYLEEGAKLDIKAIEGCVQKETGIPWFDLFSDNEEDQICVSGGDTIQAPGATEPAAEITLENADYTGSYTVKGVSPADINKVASDSDLEPLADDDILMVETDFSGFDISSDQTVKYWVKAFYNGNYYFLHRNNCTWIPIPSETHDKLFVSGEGGTETAWDHCFASDSGQLKIKDLFTKNLLDANNVVLYYGVMPVTAGGDPIPEDYRDDAHKKRVFGSEGVTELDFGSVPVGGVRGEKVSWTFSLDDLTDINKPSSFWVDPDGQGSFERTVYFSPEEEGESYWWEFSGYKAKGTGRNNTVSIETTLSDVVDEGSSIYMIPGRSITFTLKDTTSAFMNYDSIYLESPLFPGVVFSANAEGADGESNSFMLGKGQTCNVRIDTLKNPSNGSGWIDFKVVDVPVRVNGKHDLCLVGCTSDDSAVKLTAPMTYDSDTGKLVFEWPVVPAADQGETETGPDLDNKCFQLIKKDDGVDSGTSLAVESLSTLKLLVDQGVGGGDERFSYSGNGKITFKLGGENGLLTVPGVYFAKVLEKEKDDAVANCTEADFAEIPWGLEFEIPAEDEPVEP